jgi:hypothetical protein
MRNQRVGREQPANSAAYDDHIGPRLRHYLILARFHGARSGGSGLAPAA